MKEKILIVLYAYYPFGNANTNVMQPHIEALKEKYDVLVLTKDKTRRLPQKEQIDDITIVRYNKPNFIEKTIFELYHIDTKVKRKLLKRIAIIFGHTVSKIFYTVFSHPEFQAIKKICQVNEFKFVISTCETFSSHLNVLHAKKDNIITCAWFPYFMDPHAFYVHNRKSDKLRKQEWEVYETADLVFITEEIFIENQKTEFARFINKTRPVKFANFSCKTHPLLKDIFIKDKINCVYVGSLLNEEIRSPEYFYRIINGLDSRFRIYMICNNLTHCNVQIRDKVLQKKELVAWHTDLPLDECLGIIANADILINLGNRSINQTPSKIFDYISTGRPIVNFYSLEDDTSKRYLEKYPLKINIYESEEMLKGNLSCFIDFCIGVKKSQVAETKIEELYGEYIHRSEMDDMLLAITAYFNEY